MAPEFINAGVRLIGGCCGTGASHIAALRKAVDQIKVSPRENRQENLLASAYGTVSYTPELITAEMKMDVDSIRDGIAKGDFFCLMGALPLNAADAQAVLLDFGNMELDFDMWNLVSTLAMFVKQPVILTTKDAALQKEFLRCYPGRAGLLNAAGTDDDLYGALLIG
jgi:hypothetical protein